MAVELEYLISCSVPEVSMHRMRGNGHAGIQERPLSFWTVKVIKYQNSLARWAVELPNIAGDIPNPAGFDPGNPVLVWTIPCGAFPLQTPEMLMLQVPALLAQPRGHCPGTGVTPDQSVLHFEPRILS